MVYSCLCLETDTDASTPACDHSGPAWSYRPFAKRPFHPLREQDRSDDGRTASEPADLPAREVSCSIHAVHHALALHELAHGPI